MFYLEDICFLCLKNNLELHSVFVQDIDGIYFNVKLRCCFPETFDSTPDEYKLACLECFAKLRFMYESKQSVVCSSTAMRNYLDKLQFENKTLQQPSVVLSNRKRRRKDSNTKKLPEVKVENVANGIKLKITNFNLNSTNKEQVNIAEYSCQPTANKNVTLLTNYNCLTEEKDLETKNVEKYVPFTETETICVKQEPQFSNLNLNSTKEQLSTVDHSCQPTTNENIKFLTKYNCLTEEKGLETKNVETVVPVTETGTIYVKQEQQFSRDDFTTSYLDKEIEDSKDTETIYIKPEPQFCEDDSTTDYLDKESEDSEGSISSNEDDPDFEISEEETTRPNDYNNQKINAIHNSVKRSYVSGDSVKFCNTCQDLLFGDLNNINVHLHTHIQSTNCSRCKDSLKDIQKYQRHMFNHCESMFEILDKGEHGEEFSCAVCDQQFDEFSNLKQHISDKHIRSLKCVVCSRAFYIKLNLLRHILDIHCQVKLYKCKICPSRFVSKKGVKEHMIYNHYSGKSCVCKCCYQSFSNLKTLQEHISKFHGEDLRLEEDTTHDSSKKDDSVERFSCAICQKQFNIGDNLRKHLFDMHVNSLQCEICSETYTRKVGKVKHILVKHCRAKLYKCIICAKKFTHRKICDNHMLKMHNNGNAVDKELDNEVCPVTLLNGEKATCTICHQQFDVFENVRRHIYDEHMTSLDCVVCSKTFGRRRALNRHIMVQHCYLKIINCKLCPQRFASEESFKYHMNQHHSSDGVGEITELNNEVRAVTELDNKISAVTEVEKKFSAVLEPEKIFIKEDRYYSDEYDSSDEEYEADNYEIRKDFSNFVMAEESNSYTSNSFNLEESIGSSVIPNATATTEASYCERRAPVVQSNVCDICHKMFLYLSNLSEHLNAHMQESSCSMCKDSTENISRLQRHMLTPCGNTNISHDSANTANTRTNDEVTCVVCQKEFKCNILKRHMRKHITNLTCVVCNKTMSSKQNLKRHLLNHCNLKTFQCKICGKQFAAKETLKYHLNSTHSSRIVRCQHCKKAVKNPKLLIKHIKRIHPEFMYQCEVCRRIFLHKNELKKHAKRHTFSQ